MEEGTKDKRTHRNAKEHTCAASRCEPHANYQFFVTLGRERNLNHLLKLATVSEADRMGVSPEFHFARLLKTADRALADKKSWNLQVVFEKWFHLYQHDLNKLSPAKDKETRLLEFLAATSECELGYGESPLSRAAAQVAKRPPPPELKKFDNENLRKLACFCRGLAEQDQFGEMRFFLDARSAAKVVGKSDGMTGLRLMNALCALQVLKITKRGTRGKNGKSTRYQYIASDANEEVDNES